MAKKETKKEKWQRIAKEQKVKFQENDTISMLQTSVAYKLNLDPEKLKGGKLEKAIEEALLKKATAKKPDAKKTPAKKPAAKKNITIEAPKDLQTPKVAIPKFKDVAEMKNFCVSTGLNLIDGYILETKGKKADFLSWIEKNIDKANPPAKTSTSDNPHSPHAGIGELSNIDKAKASVAPASSEGEPKINGAVATPKMDLPKLSYGDYTEEMPNALSENANMMDDGASTDAPSAAPKHDTAKAMNDYAISIIHHLKANVMFRINGGITRGALNAELARANKEYKYEIVDDKQGSYLEVSDTLGNKCRIPSNGYLPMA